MGTTTTVRPEPVAGPTWTERGSSAYRRVSLALVLAGFVTFSLLYSVQPLLPAFAQDFRVGPAESSLALSRSTGFLAIAILCAAAVSEVVVGRRLMFASLIGAAILNMVDAIAPSWQALLIARAMEGFVLGGVPAVAMAYLAAEIHPRGLGLSVGLCVGGAAFGGMFGRVIVGALTQFTSWRMAFGGMRLFDLVAAVGFFVLLPVPRNFVRQPQRKLRSHLAAWHGHLRPGPLPLLFLIGCLLMGAFVAVYNYAAFRLTGAPNKLDDTEISLIFLVYLFGAASSGIAGALSDRHGRGPVLIAGIAIAGIGVALTLLHPATGIICGIAVLTIGFFIGHSTASGWVPSAAVGAKGHASSLCLLAYYLGSSVIGSMGGWFWSAGRWPAVAAFVIVLLTLASLAGLLLLRWRPPLSERGEAYRAFRMVEKRPENSPVAGLLPCINGMLRAGGSGYCRKIPDPDPGSRWQCHMVIARRDGRSAGRSFVDPIVEPFVIDAERLEVSRDLHGPRQKVLDGGFSGIADRMTLCNAQLPIDLQMKFDKGSIASVSGPQVMNGADARARQNHIPDMQAIAFGEFAIEKLRENAVADAVGVPHHVSRDQERDNRIGAFPAGRFCDDERNQHAGVERDIAHIMRTVGCNCGRAGLAHNPRLQGDESGRRDHTAEDHHYSDIECSERHRKHKPLDRLDGEHDACAREKGRLRETSDRLAFAMAKPMIPVGWLPGKTHPEKSHEAGSRVHKGVDRRSQQSDRTRGKPCDEFHRDQAYRDEQAGTGRKLA